MSRRFMRRLTTAVVTLLAAAPALAQEGSREFRIHATTTELESFPAVARSSSGDFVVVWNVRSRSGYYTFSEGFSGRLFDGSGQPRGVELEIDVDSDNVDTGPVTAIDGGGEFIVVWHDRDRIHAQPFDAGGEVRGERFVVAESVSYQTPSVSGDEVGNWVVVWNATFGQAIVGRRYDASGETWGMPFQVNEETAFPVVSPAVAAQPDGDFVVVWRRAGGPGGDDDAVFGRRFTSAGEPRGGEFQASQSAGRIEDAVAVAVDDAGRFIVAWRQATPDEGILARSFDASASPLGDEIAVSVAAGAQSRPSIALAGPGDFLVAWNRQTGGPEERRYELRGRSFDPFGSPRGGDFLLTLLAPDGLSAPGVARAPDGTVVVFAVEGDLFGRLLPGSTAGVLQLADDPDRPFSRLAEDDASVGVPVIRTGGSQGRVTVEYFTADAAERPATAGEDYEPASGKLIFEDGEVRKNFSFELREDQLREGDESLMVGLRNPSGGATLRTPSMAEVVIYDDESPTPGRGPSARGVEHRANSLTDGAQRFPSVATNAAGDALVVWQSLGQDGDWTVHGRLFGVDGRPRGDEIRISAGTSTGERPAVAGTPDGSFLVTWIQRFEVRGRRVLPPAGGAGPEVSGELRLGGCDGCARVLASELSVDETGRFVVVVSGSEPLTGGYYGAQAPFVVQAQRFAVDGTPTGDYSSHSSQGPQAAVSSARNGDFLVVWNHRDLVEGRRLDADGIEIPTGRFEVDPGPLAPFRREWRVVEPPFDIHPDVVRQPDESFLVVWQQENRDVALDGLASGGLDVYGRRYTADGAPLTDRFRINRYLPGAQRQPRAAAAPTGEHVVVWTSEGQLGPGRRDIFARRFQPFAGLLGSRFPVNPSPHPQSSPDVAMDAGGGFIVVWESEVADGDFDIFVQRFSGPPCVPGRETLCLGEGRFRVTVEWEDFSGNTGPAKAVPLTADTGAFWFFGADNLELMLKVLDGRAFTGHYWVFYGSLSNVGFTVTVTDTVTGNSKRYVNPPGEFASVGDVQALPGD